MKRKKFVKQLQALGYQRNTANGMAMYARMGHWTYEQYLQIEKKHRGQYHTLENARRRAMVNIKTSLTECLTPGLKTAQQAMERLRDTLAGREWETTYLGKWVTKQVAVDPSPESPPPWPKENPHRCDAVDALRYATLLHPLPDNIQVMIAPEHDALHGYSAKCYVDELETAPGGGQK